MISARRAREADLDKAVFLRGSGGAQSIGAFPDIPALISCRQQWRMRPAFRRGAPWKARVVRPGGSGVRRPKPLWGNRMTIELHTWNTPNGRKISVALEE